MNGCPHARFGRCDQRKIGWGIGPHDCTRHEGEDVGCWSSLSGGILGPMRRPSVIAHRGASGYEYENSRAAFRRAVMLDADGIELDVHATLDGVIVVHHDPEIPGVGPIAMLTGAEARQVRIRN